MCETLKDWSNFVLISTRTYPDVEHSTTKHTKLVKKMIQYTR